MIHETLSKIQSGLKAPKNLYNEFGKFKYRSAESILEALKPYLKENNASLTLSDSVIQVGDRFYIESTATLYAGGESLSVKALARESLDKKGMDSAQLTGACSSYARKYALGGLFLLDDSNDIESLDNSHNGKTQSHTESHTQATQPTQDEPSHKVLNLLLNAGLSAGEIKDFMATRGYRSSDKATMQKLLDNAEVFKLDALRYFGK